MEWVQNEPTRIGWYWFKGTWTTYMGREGYQTTPIEKRVVQVFDYCGDLMGVMSNGTAEKLEYLKGVWYGPIEEPE